MANSLLSLINAEYLSISQATEATEKANRLNNIIQLKVHSNDIQLRNDIYVDVKQYIYFYINSLKEKQYNYDEFSEQHVIDLIQLFKTDQQCNLFEYVLRELKREHFFEKTNHFEHHLNKVEFRSELQNFKFSRLFQLAYKASVYNGYTIGLSLFLCFLFCYIIYLPAPTNFPVIFKINYHDVSDVFTINHSCNILMSIFDIQQDKFILPTNLWGTILLLAIKCFFIAIVVNVFVDQFKSRFRI